MNREFPIFLIFDSYSKFKIQNSPKYFCTAITVIP